MSAQYLIHRNVLVLVDLPPLERLYLQSEIEDDHEINEIKWKIFGWIMSFSAEEISIIKRLPKDLQMTSATLLALVKVRFQVHTQFASIQVY